MDREGVVTGASVTAFDGTSDDVGFDYLAVRHSVDGMFVMTDHVASSMSDCGNYFLRRHSKSVHVLRHNLVYSFVRKCRKNVTISHQIHQQKSIFVCQSSDNAFSNSQPTISDTQCIKETKHRTFTYVRLG